MPPLAPEDAARRVRDAGAVPVDLRAQDEDARERISGAHPLPLSRLEAAPVPAGAPRIVRCRSGARTAPQARRLDIRAEEGGGPGPGGRAGGQDQGTPA